MADARIIGNFKSFNDFQEAAKKNSLAEALTMAQIAKATAPDPLDITKMGQAVLVKKQMGIPTTPQEDAIAQVYNASTEGIYTDYQGNVVKKPGVLERLGQPTAQRSASANPPASPSLGFSTSMAPTTPDKTGNVGSFPGVDDGQVPTSPQPSSAVDNFIAANPLPPTARQKRQQEMKQSMDAELASVGNSPKLRNEVKQKYINANSPMVKFEQENKLRDEFNTLTKDFRTVQDAYSKINQTSGTGAGDMSMLYSYIKLLDPGSVVRESEFATAAASGSFGERVAGAVKSIQEGGRMSPSLRQAFLDEATNIYTGQKEGYDRAKTTYTGLAESNDLNVKNVVTDYAQSKSIDPRRSAFEAKKAGKITEIKNDNDYNSLPSGAKYKAPDGTIRTKR